MLSLQIEAKHLYLQFFEFMNREQLNALEEKIKKLREQLAEISGALVELQYDLKQKSSSS